MEERRKEIRYVLRVVAILELILRTVEKIAGHQQEHFAHIQSKALHASDLRLPCRLAGRIRPRD